jgi:hypothetical protein
MIDNPILFLLFLAFCISIVWSAITLVRTLQRIAQSLEQIVRQNEERLKH